MHFFQKKLLLAFFAVIAIMLSHQASAALKIISVNPISNKKILPNTAFPKGDNTIRAIACPGEYEPNSVAIRSSEDLLGVKPVITDLKYGKNKISAANINIKYVLCWWQDHSAWKAIAVYYKGEKIKQMPPVLVPELLVNDPTLVKFTDSPKSNQVKLSFPAKTDYINIPCKYTGKIIPYDFKRFPVKDSVELQAIDLKADTNQQIWITIKTPADAAPGLYTGKLDFKKAGKTIGSISIRFRVLPFKLVKSKLLYGLYYIGILTQKTHSALTCYTSSLELMKIHWKNMLAHGINNWIIYQPWEKGKALNDLEEVLKLRQELGINDRPLYYCGLTTSNTLRPNSRIPISKPETVAKLKSLLTELKKLCDKYKIPEFYVHACDENHKAAAQDRIKVWDLVHSAGGKIMSTQFHPQKSLEFKKNLDLLNYGFGLPTKIAEEFHKNGNKVIGYCYPQSGVENPWLYRLRYGQELWSSGLDGVMNYAYMREMGNPWNDFDHLGYRDHLFVYPTINGIIETIAWEGMREAIDDTKYIATLEQCIIDAKEQKNELKQAKKYLSNLKKNAAFRNPATVRLEVINWILKLKGIQI